MKSRDIRAKLKEEFNSSVPDVLDRVLDAPLVNQPALIIKPSKSFFYKRALALSCVLVVTFMLGVGFSNVYYEISASVSIDINPSIGIDINRFDRIIAVRAYNGEAETLIGGLKLRNLATGKAVDEILSSAREKGYLANAPADNAILLSVWASESAKAAKLENSIQSDIGKHFDTHHINSEVRFENVDTSIYHHAQAANISSGKVKLTDSIMQYDSKLDKNELLSKPINELFDVYDRCKSMQSQGHHGSAGDDSEASETPPPVPSAQPQKPNTPADTQKPGGIPTPLPPALQKQTQPQHKQGGHMNDGNLHH